MHVHSLEVVEDVTSADSDTSASVSRTRQEGQTAGRRRRRSHHHRGGRTPPISHPRADTHLLRPWRTLAGAQCLATGLHDVLRHDIGRVAWDLNPGPHGPEL